MLLTALLAVASLASSARADDPLMQVDPRTVPAIESRPSSETRERMGSFEQLAPRVGENAPDFALKNLNGRTVSLEDFEGKEPVILVLGSASCNFFREGYPRVAKALLPYRNDVALLVLYTLEAHPAGDKCPYADGEWTGTFNLADKILVRQPRTSEERARIARAFATRMGIEAGAVLLDGMDNESWKDYGGLPSSVFVIDQQGRIVYKSAIVGSRRGPDGTPLSVAAARALVKRSAR